MLITRRLVFAAYKAHTVMRNDFDKNFHTIKNILFFKKLPKNA